MNGAILAQAADPGVVRQAVEDVLARPEYDGAATGESIIERILGRLLEAVGQVLARTIDPSTGSLAQTLIGLGLIGVFIALLIWLVRRFRKSTVLDVEISEDVGRTPRDWAAEAEAHEWSGNHREALRCRYRETVALLAQRRLVDEVPGRTTGEYRRRVARALPAAADPFGDLTDRFEVAFYGGRAVDADGLARARDAQRQVIRAAGGRIRATPAVGARP